MKKLCRLIRRVMLLSLVAAACSGMLVAGRGYQAYREAVNEVSLDEKVADIRSRTSYTDFEDLPETYIEAVVAVEDHRFYEHRGIDVIAICRAALHDLRAGAFVEGGSTIPQQLAKNMYFSQEKQLSRKVAEIFVALQLKREYSDEEILELYVNSIYFGDGYYDVASASAGYFGKEPSEMSDYECTLLAGVPNAPSRYALSKHLERALERQLIVVRRMEEEGYFSSGEAETVVQTAAQAAGMSQLISNGNDT